MVHRRITRTMVGAHVSCGQGVLVDQTTQAIGFANSFRAGRCASHLLNVIMFVRCDEGQGAVRAVTVVVLDILA
jgi:hypothetical protein